MYLEKSESDSAAVYDFARIGRRTRGGHESGDAMAESCGGNRWCCRRSGDAPALRRTFCAEWRRAVSAGQRLQNFFPIAMNILAMVDEGKLGAQSGH